MKIKYGIDLGTTNSAIARIENGEPVIKKTDTLKDTMPSCIGFNKKGHVLYGDSANNAFNSEKIKAMKGFNSDKTNVFKEFKRTMGTDKKYESSNTGKSYSSEDLSAEVLKSLRAFVSDDEVQAAIVTVPANFDIRQKDATKRAATNAGLKQVELLQEPIAASIAYGLKANIIDGFWLVFDFGGGTFDAALVRVEDGIMQVVDTAGDNYLGGKNIDDAIVEKLIIPYFKTNYSIDSILEDDSKKAIFQFAMKHYAEEAKIQLSFKESYNILSDLGDIPGEDDDGEEFELDLTITQQEFKQAVEPIFQKAVNITKELIERNNLNGSNLESLILVGGPTYSPVLREMLADQIKEPDTSVDPMTAVAVGAALYAATIEVDEELQDQTRDRTKIQLDLGYDGSTAETTVFVAIKVLPDKTEGSIPEQIFAEFIRGDKAWASGKVEINEAGDIIEAQLLESKANTFHVQLYDGEGNKLDCEPDSFSILQGSVVGNASLPHNIGVEIKRQRDGKLIFTTIPGLEKNQSVPATGIRRGLKTQNQVRPGVTEDFIRIPIYQGADDAEGTRAINNKHIYDALITGDDIPSLLPEGSEVDLTMVTDKSGRIDKILVFFPYLDHTVELSIPEAVDKELEASYLDKEIKKARGEVKRFKDSGHVDSAKTEELEAELSRLEGLLNSNRKDYDRKLEVLDNLKKVFLKIDSLSDHLEWPVIESELREVFDFLEKTNNELGNQESSKLVEEFKRKVDEVIRNKDAKLAQALIEDIRYAQFMIARVHYFIVWIRDWNDNFNAYRWRNAGQARQLVNAGLERIATGPTAENLNPIVAQLVGLLPQDEKPDDGGPLLQG